MNTSVAHLHIKFGVVPSIMAEEDNAESGQMRIIGIFHLRNRFYGEIE